MDIDPNNTEFGDDCGSLTDGLCANVPECKKCSWGWPSDDSKKWNSDKAACRCD